MTEAKELLTALSTWATPILVALVAFFLKQWFGRIEAAIKELSSQISKLKTQQAVANERDANVQGKVESLASSIKETDKSVGRLSSSVEKVWLVLQNSELVKSRMSDFGGNR